jgi:hypothetical protein
MVLNAVRSAIGAASFLTAVLVMDDSRNSPMMISSAAGFCPLAETGRH